MNETEIAALIDAWSGGDPDGKMYDACTEKPEIAWHAILKIVQGNLTEDQEALLAAGPLEDLLAFHGSDFIDRCENEAKINPRFNHLLGGVWCHEMPDEIWRRIEKARKEVW